MIIGFQVEDARNIAYYLTRYFKGSPHLEENGKDIFADIFDNEADGRIRATTLEVIEEIEKAVGSPASEFDEATTDRILDAITDFEDSITERPSESQAEDAESFLDKAVNPAVTPSRS
ncbi:hypothetical protein [Rhizobium etli]|nr:hypothetical protein [Rhizobium etli]MBB4481047.1 hypothetical protein [Rhizobium etli]